MNYQQVKLVGTPEWRAKKGNCNQFITKIRFYIDRLIDRWIIDR